MPENDAAVAGSTLPLMALGCVLAAGLSALLVRRMIGLAVMDVPGARSAHDRPVPRGGGVGIVAAVLAGTPAMMALLPGGGASPVVAAALLEAAVALLAVVSWIDDLRGLGYRAKLAAQLGAALLGMAAVLAVAPVLPGRVLLLPGCVAALGWILVCTNALNFIDGLNGLASGVALLAGMFGAVLGWMQGDPLLVAPFLMLAAGAAGFLPFNFPAARIFLGDVGSQVCGLLLGVLGLLAFADGVWTALGLFLPLVLGGVLWDVAFTLCRRALAGERLTQAHRGHLYQLAARRVTTPRMVALLHWGFAAWGGGLALVLLPERPAPAVALALAPQLAWTWLVRHRTRRAGPNRWS